LDEDVAVIPAFVGMTKVPALGGPLAHVEDDSVGAEAGAASGLDQRIWRPAFSAFSFRLCSAMLSRQFTAISSGTVLLLERDQFRWNHRLGLGPLAILCWSLAIKARSRLFAGRSP
jgi:hypothetical protein